MLAMHRPATLSGEQQLCDLATAAPAKACPRLRGAYWSMMIVSSASKEST
jgi:hypothetical protein